MKAVNQSVVLLIAALIISGCGSEKTSTINSDKANPIVPNVNNPDQNQATSENSVLLDKIRKQVDEYRAAQQKSIEELKIEGKNLLSDLNEAKEKQQRLDGRSSNESYELSRVIQDLNYAVEQNKNSILMYNSLLPYIHSLGGVSKHDLIRALVPVMKANESVLSEANDMEVIVYLQTSFSFWQLRAKFAEYYPEDRLYQLSTNPSNLSNRDVRLGNGGLKVSNFDVNGEYFDQAAAFDIPLVVQLKGNLDTSGRTSSDAVGSVAYNFNGWIAGVVHGYAHDIKSYVHESAVMISRTLNGFFVEGYSGMLAGSSNYDQRLSGSRYLVTVGYDSTLVSPFVQYEYLDQKVGFGDVKRQGFYVGIDTDVVSLQTSEAIFTSKVLAKMGYESGFKSSPSAYMEWQSTFRLNSGLEVSTLLNIGSGESTYQLKCSFEQ